ncbi:MAG: site-specific DNA-methyltransferase [Pelistega sp.]|nr:site-specific DNA-methyltransferase [Pelistega sp.]
MHLQINGDSNFNKVPTTYLPKWKQKRMQVLKKYLSNNFMIYNADSFSLMEMILEKHPNGCFDMIFADPPYFLSNNGITCKSGKIASVNKGEWDKSEGFHADLEFYERWLKLSYSLLKPNGTIWVCGSQHNIYMVGYTLQKLGYYILNNITWEKPDPPPNLSCRYFTHSFETLLWAKKSKSAKHTFNYQQMCGLNGGEQMKCVWTIAPPKAIEKLFGKHPTQKPLALIERCILAASNEGDLIFDPFMGSASTGVAALNLQRKFCGSEIDTQFFELSKRKLSVFER